MRSLPKIAWVRWKDASMSAWEGNVSEADIVGLVYMFSCGVFVKETCEYVALAVDHHFEDGDYRLVQCIPKVNIVEWKLFEVQEDGSLNAFPAAT